MKALVKARPEPGIWMQQVPRPEPRSGEVLIKISKTAICGTDLHLVRWDAFAARFFHPPRIIGHEFVGAIAALGQGVKGFAVGERVTGEGHITCGACRHCRNGLRHLCPNTQGIGSGHDGAFAEYLVMPAENLWRVPPEVPSEVAAIHDPLGNAVHTALAFDLVGKDVLITGAGPIGIMAAKICGFAGARHVVLTDVNDYRLGLARSMGIDQAINVAHDTIDDVRLSLAMDDGFDIGLEMSGNPTAFNDMIAQLCHGGNIAILGFIPPSTTINWDDVIFKQLTLKGIYGRKIFTTWEQMTRMLLSGLDVAPIITHRFPIDRYQAAFDLALSGECGKVILEWE
ncbi:MAG: L-threonine 3-dehydrogenase [Pseudomonadota bacterium]